MKNYRSILLLLAVLPFCDSCTPVLINNSNINCIYQLSYPLNSSCDNGSFVSCFIYSGPTNNKTLYDQS